MFDSLLNNITHQQLNNLFKENGYELRFVGGCVRDTLLGMIPKDIDFVTNATPEQMLLIHCKKIETGLQHGTITFVINNENYEITTLRTDHNCDGRHATVNYTTDFKLDASRRDFTCNALSLDFDGNVYDYYNGINDIKNKIIRFIGEPDKRIKEDYLRILRYFRFVIKLQATNNILYKKEHFEKHYSKLYFTISKERIYDELSKILQYPNKNVRDYILSLMNDYGILSLFRITHTKSKLLSNLNCLEEYLGWAENKRELLEILMKSFKCSTNNIKYALFIQRFKDMPLTNLIHYHIMDKINKDWLLRICEIRNEPKYYKKLLNDLRKYNNQPCPVNGNDLLSLGYVGEDIGLLLHMIKLKWIKSEFTLNKDELLGMI